MKKKKENITENEVKEVNEEKTSHYNLLDGVNDVGNSIISGIQIGVFSGAIFGVTEVVTKIIYSFLKKK